MSDDNGKGGNALAAGVAGAVIGAAAAAAAIALADEKNREKAEEILKNMQKEGNKIFQEISKRAMEMKEVLTKNSGEESKKLKAKGK